MSSNIFGSDETIKTTALAVRNLSEVIAPNAIRQEHRSIGSDLIQRVQMMFDRQPTIEGYSVSKSWDGKAVENLKLKLEGAVLELSLRQE